MIDTRASVRAMTVTKATLRRAWNVRGFNRRRRRSQVNRRCTASSAFREGVTDTPHGQDECGRRRVVLDLLPEMADMDVDRLLVLVERLVVAQQFEQFATRVDPPRARGEVTEDLELGGR